MKLIVGFAIFLATLQVSLAEDNKTRVGVHYEALCPYSKRFIVDQVVAHYDELSPIAYFDLHPCGKANCTKDAEGVSQCDCQHGEVECSQNRMQGCALDALSGNEPSQIKFVGCAMQLASASYEPCCQEVGLNYETILACSNGQQGHEIMHRECSESDQLVEETNMVPTVRFNGRYSVLKHSDALADLVAAIHKERDGTYAALEAAGVAVFAPS